PREGDGAGARTFALDYGRHWQPEDQRTARLAIFNSEDEARFEQSGERDAARVCSLVTPESTVLDFGCGTGRVARYVAPHCAELWAVDVSPRMLELTRERLPDATNLRFAFCEEVSIPEVAASSVDVVYSFLVLQHLEREDAYLALRELHRVLRPGGAAILTFPNLLADVYLEGFLHYARTGAVTNPARARVYTPQEVERVLPAAGFSVVDLEAGNDIVVTCRPAS
ncbi:MAG: class I SAM-dependent methyltransferase, partial [Acidimicrobiales bacterium]